MSEEDIWEDIAAMFESELADALELAEYVELEDLER